MYEKPLPIQLAVYGSRSKINCGTTVNVQYQTINCDWMFDVVNLDNYDAILGTPFLYQHQVAMGFNPSRVIVGSSKPLELEGPEVTTLNSAAAGLSNRNKTRDRTVKDESGDESPTAIQGFPRRNRRIDLDPVLASVTAVAEPIVNDVIRYSSDIDDPHLPEAFAMANISVISMDDVAMGNKFPNEGEFTV